MEPENRARIFRSVEALTAPWWRQSHRTAALPDENSSAANAGRDLFIG
jgi:hypothetical protein